MLFIYLFYLIFFIWFLKHLFTSLKKICQICLTVMSCLLDELYSTTEISIKLSYIQKFKSFIYFHFCKKLILIVFTYLALNSSSIHTYIHIYVYSNMSVCAFVPHVHTRKSLKLRVLNPLNQKLSLLFFFSLSLSLFHYLSLKMWQLSIKPLFTIFLNTSF